MVSRFTIRHSRGAARSRGFTLIEMLIVISIMVTLISIAVPIYTASITHAKEAVLRDDLFTLRSCIDQYTMDKQKAPQSLDDLVAAGYLKQLPVDPFTGRNDSWVPTQDDTLMDPSQTEPGITDVHSGSSMSSSDGSAYSSW